MPCLMALILAKRRLSTSISISQPVRAEAIACCSSTGGKEMVVLETYERVVASGVSMKHAYVCGRFCRGFRLGFWSR